MARPTLYIHVGLPKTGTTSLQVFCMRNRAWLAQQGICYPVTMRAPQPTASQHRYINAAMRQEFASGRDGTWVLSALADEIEESGLSRALISEEQFSYESARAAPWLAQLRARFDCRILVFLRRPDRWAESMYAQAVRGGYSHDFAAFLGAAATRERLDHTGFQAIWAEAFGSSDVLTATYEEHGASSVEILARVLDLPPLSGPPPERFNASLSGEAIAFIRHLNLPDGAFPAFNRQFAKRLAGITSSAPFVGFSSSGRAEFITRWTGAPHTADGDAAIPTSLGLCEKRHRQILLALLDLPDMGQSPDQLTAHLAAACVARKAA